MINGELEFLLQWNMSNLTMIYPLCLNQLFLYMKWSIIVQTLAIDKNYENCESLPFECFTLYGISYLNQ